MSELAFESHGLSLSSRGTREHRRMRRSSFVCRPMTLSSLSVSNVSPPVHFGELEMILARRI